MGEPLNPEDPATNNVAEIKAAIAAIEIVKNYGMAYLDFTINSHTAVDLVPFTFPLQVWND